ncbi:MAG: Dabb family protein [Sedimentisphaerales bacterium]|nr:Dabb family protein [Sedimentisphaerales bacterium]
MLRNTLFLTAVAIILSGCVVNIQREDGLPKDTEVLRHVVLFKFKDTSSSREIREVVDAFRALPGKVDEISDFEWGTDVSVENLQQGFTHCFLVTFRNEDDRAAYLPHPAHKQFGKMLGPHLDKVLVIDYWSEK